MARILQLVLYAVGLPLECLVVLAMLRARAWRDLPFVFVYATAGLAVTLVEFWVFAARWMGMRRPRTMAYFYWIDEGVMGVLVFVAVVSLIYVATKTLENRTMIRRVLIALAVLFAAASLAIHYDAHAVVGSWMTLVSRDISLCTAILDLALWSFLLAFRPSDYRLLLLSGGLGIQFTGEAIAHSLRSWDHVAYPVMIAASIFIPLTNIACTYIWWHTFRTSPNPAKLRLPAEAASGEPRRRAARP
jgi:hypothetical protein